MIIEKDKVATFHYRIKEDDILLEDSTEGDPMMYLHGHDGIFPGLESALEGKATGDVVEVKLKPEQAYGYRNEAGLQRIPVKHLLSRRPVKGAMAKVNTADGPRDVLVVKLGKFMVDVDFNHPLAGKTLDFEITVDSVRDASAEEIEHGHAHGRGGHQH